MAEGATTNRSWLAQVAPYAGIVLVGGLLAGGILWRLAQPARPTFVLGEQALALYAAWRTGGLNLAAPQAGPVAAGVSVRPGEGGAPPALSAAAPLPRIPAPLVAVGRLTVEGLPAAAAGFTGPGQHALLLVLDETASTLFGDHQERLKDEWAHYTFDGGQSRLVVWTRAGQVFALVTDLPIADALRALPPPTVGRSKELVGQRSPRAEDVFRPPGSADPAQRPKPPGTADPTAGATP